MKNTPIWLKLVISFSLIAGLSAYFDEKSKTDLQSSLNKVATGAPTTSVGYNPVPLIVILGVIATIFWLLLPHLQNWFKQEDYFGE